MSETVSVAQALQDSGIMSSEARSLLMQLLGVHRSWLVAHSNHILDPEQIQRYRRLCERRRAGEPMAYLLGEREFFGLVFEVSPAVLIPRPESELLVELALARIPTDRAMEVLDLGTGCGAIAIAIAKARLQARITATDISAEALQLAQANARRHGVDNVQWLLSDWYRALNKRTFDVIVSNPPYVAKSDAHLQQGDVRYEPLLALSPGEDALSALRTIIEYAPEHLKSHGSLIVEHGYDQTRPLRRLFRDAEFENITDVRDLAGIERVICGTV